jgi:hypothetical protein
VTARQAGLTGTVSWRQLPDTVRAAFNRRLEGMYGGGNDETVFDSLTLDKQQALLIFLRRFQCLKLWDTVCRIENLYGEGGVGMHFDAWPFIRSTLERRREFTTWFATHRGMSGGFVERGAGQGSLHILYRGDGSGMWEVHFDLYNPWASPLNAWRHLLHEKMRKETPDWRTIAVALGYMENDA